MGLTVVVGSQYGGEGKGAVNAYLAHTDKPVALIKTGGPNSAHTYGTSGALRKVRMVPSGAEYGASYLVFPPGCLIHVETLRAEVASVGFGGKLLIHPKAGVIDSEHIATQRSDAFYDTAGSTRTGSGAAAADRARRRLRLAGEIPELRSHLGDTTDYVVNVVDQGQSVLAEGAQGFCLSNYHGEYPYVSSRDCTVGAVLSQIGIGPKYLDTVVLVAKCFPTRNSHGQGTLPNLIGAGDGVDQHVLEEKGGGNLEGGDAVRRVAYFDMPTLLAAVRANTPTFLAITGLDRLKALEANPIVQARYGSADSFVKGIEVASGLRVSLRSWGPHVEDMHDLRGGA